MVQACSHRTGGSAGSRAAARGRNRTAPLACRLLGWWAISRSQTARQPLHARPEMEPIRLLPRRNVTAAWTCTAQNDRLDRSRRVFQVLRIAVAAADIRTPALILSNDVAGPHCLGHTARHGMMSPDVPHRRERRTDIARPPVSEHDTEPTRGDLRRTPDRQRPAAAIRPAMGTDRLSGTVDEEWPRTGARHHRADRHVSGAMPRRPQGPNDARRQRLP